mgnify:CR=1 FL=1
MRSTARSRWVSFLPESGGVNLADGIQESIRVALSEHLFIKACDEAADGGLAAKALQEKINANEKERKEISGIQKAARENAQALREELIELGLPAEQIAFIHDAETDSQKARLFRQVREGKVRVLLGSTPKMGVGTNVQRRLVALHELDCPWRPCDVEQREGRILRQGNECAEVEIIRYVTEGSFDAYSWQTVLTKAKFIAQVMSGDKGIRSVEDVELATLTYAEVKALASGKAVQAK